MVEFINPHLEINHPRTLICFNSEFRPVLPTFQMLSWKMRTGEMLLLLSMLVNTSANSQELDDIIKTGGRGPVCLPGCDAVIMLKPSPVTH